MATIKSEYYRLNGTSWDLHLFRTRADMVDETSSRSFLSADQKDNISTYLTTFNADSS